MTGERRVVLIAGGTSGIGFATAKLFLEEQATVVLIGRSEKKGRQALAELCENGEKCHFLRGDIANVTECQSLIDSVIALFGRLDVLVNSAGIYHEQSIEETTEADYDHVMDVNIKGTFFLCKFAAMQMKKQQAGAIVNVSSDAGINGNFFCAAYCASKGAVTVFSKALALELAPHNIRVNCVCPGDIDTPMTTAQFHALSSEEQQRKEMSLLYPIGRIGNADEVAAVIYFLASSKAGFVVGAAWSVDGGITAY